jgi:pimeloyl-ACP methyl ester carboxylesterase
MKKWFAFVWCLYSVFTTHGQEITGLWHGVLNIGSAQLRLDLDIQKKGDSLTGKFISLDQGNALIPLSTVKLDGNKISLGSTMAKLQYDGTILNEKIEGLFSQNGQKLPMTFTRNLVEKKVLNRPQEPKPPFPYASEDLQFFNAKDNVMLAGTLTKPSTGANWPVVVLISGSGPQNRNEELAGHKPFLVLADHLTRNGIAVLRYDDRGVAQSKGVFATATSADFANDVDAAVTYLKSRKDVNIKKIGLIGHSEGGLIAPMVAARNKDVAYIVLMAGPGVNGKEVLRIQIDLLNRAAGMSEVESQKQVAFTTGIMDIIQMGGDSTVKSAALRAYLYKGYEALPDDVKKQMTEQQFSQEYSSFNTPWFSYFMQYEPAPALEKIKIPVLALNGTKDLQVWAPQNLLAIEKALKKGRNKKYLIKELPNLNHLFQEAKTGGSSEYSEIEQTLSPLLLEEITRFLKQKTNLP